LDDPCLVISGLPSDTDAALRWLDGHHPITDFTARLGQPWADWLLTRLNQQGLLADGPPLRRPCRISFTTDGYLADRIAQYWSGYGQPVVAEPPEVVIVAPDTAEADRVLARQLTEAGQPHLIARQGYGRATLGPFVIPGATSCLSCLDLARRRLDPAWPLLAFQLARLTGPDELEMIDWLAGAVVTQLLTWAAGRLPETGSATQSRQRHQGTGQWTGWPAQPECFCRQLKPVPSDRISALTEAVQPDQRADAGARRLWHDGSCAHSPRSPR
jgi:hypothetical protein